MDTTLRDGEQTQNVSFTPEEKLHIAKLLLGKLNVPRIEVSSARVSEGEKNSVKLITKWAKKNNMRDKVEVLGFVDGGKSIDWIREAGGRVLNLLTKGSLKHLKGQLGKTPKQHFQDIAKVIQYAHSHRFVVNVYMEDWSNGYRDSRDYSYDMTQFLIEAGARRIMLPDTLGVMVPREVYEALCDLTERFPNAHFDFHPHNDYGLGTANVLEAIRGGAKGVHATVNCLGERTGNAALEQIVPGIHDHLKKKTGVKEKYLYLISHVVETFSGKRVAANAPIVGEDVFTQTAGIHADGDKKGGLYENPLKPDRFGRTRQYALGKLAGKASLEQNLKRLGMELSPENFNKVLQKIIELGDQKKIVTPEELPFIISDVLDLPEEKAVRIKQVSILSGKGIAPVCTMSIEYKGNVSKVTGSGDGGYDAFMTALRAWAKKNHIDLPTLKDYEVRIPPGGKTSALVECKITWDYRLMGKQKDFMFSDLTTRGLNPDQTMAAVEATEKMLNILLGKTKP
ncbi:MAG: 2-isopropylmalate synthase [Candidatus Hydrogenedentota bacterium]|nr:MAG: 2-isopropylmalate synthase [Candidatus Hydrogenedentota bacterium]